MLVESMPLASLQLGRATFPKTKVALQRTGKELGMVTRQRWALATLVGGAILLAAQASSEAQLRKQGKEESLIQRIARKSKVNEQDTEKVIRFLGPAITEELANGKTVVIEGLGTFRVVQVPA